MSLIQNVEDTRNILRSNDTIQLKSHNKKKGKINDLYNFKNYRNIQILQSKLLYSLIM